MALTIRTPAITTPSIKTPGISLPGFTPTTNYKQGPVAPGSPPVSYAPLGDWKTPMGLTQNWGQSSVPATSWFTNPSELVKSLSAMAELNRTMPPVIPNNAQGQPDMSLLPRGWTSSGPTTLSWAVPKPPPAPTMTRLTTPAPAKATKATTPAVKTPVVAPKAK